jgi:hypothetical protein
MISPPSLVFVSAKPSVRHGAVGEQLPTSMPVIATNVRCEAASAGAEAAATASVANTRMQRAMATFMTTPCSIDIFEPAPCHPGFLPA